MRLLRSGVMPWYMAVVFSAPLTGERTIEDVLEASAQMRKSR